MTTASAGDPLATMGLSTRERRMRVVELLSEHDLDGLIVSAGADMAYLLGHWSHPSERPQLLIVPTGGEAAIVIAEFESRGLPALDEDVRVIPYGEVTNPYDLAVEHMRSTASGSRLAVSDQMWSRFLLALMERLPDTTFRRAGPLLSRLRMRKDGGEVAVLREAANRADTVWPSLFEVPLAGRTEADVGLRLRRLLEEAGLRQASAIVASGPNGASPHHRTGERIIQAHELVVLDFGGTLNGYWADITRTVAVGEPTEEMRSVYETVRQAQQAAVGAVRPGVTCEAVDAAARTVIAEAGYGEAFIHRTGHGIGLDGHEEPYIIAGNKLPLEAGMTFSIEPGIYLTGKFGVRVEDIVVVTESAVERLNQTPRELRIVE